MATAFEEEEEPWELSVFWQQQFELARVSREASIPHSYARSAALSSKAHSSQPIVTLADLAVRLVNRDAPSTQPRTPVRGGGGGANANSGGGPGPDRREQMEEERIRHINEDLNHQYWTSLDFSGQGLLTVSLRIVEYDFLQRLYLNNNHLSRVPPAITKMSNLRLLDFSGNYLTELPSEIGLMKNLRYLFLFDNQLHTLPFELGTLFRLKLLGIEGNPWCQSEENAALKTIFAREGTAGLIVDLRDRAPVGDPPTPREWMQISSPSTREDLKEDGDAKSQIESSDDKVPTESADFSILNYNTLCSRYATASMYGYTPSWALSWEYRSQLLIEEVLAYQTDVICLEEVNTLALEETWMPMAEKYGYKVLFYPKSRARTMDTTEAKQVDGSVIIYRASKFKLLEKAPIEINAKALLREDLNKSVDTFNRVMVRDNVALIAVFEHIPTNQLIIISTAHLHWDPAFSDVKLVQTAILLEETEKIAAKYASSQTPEGAKYPKLREVKNIPVIVCGDFNSMDNSGVYQLITHGHVPPNSPDFQTYSYGKYTQEGIKHRLPLKSVYPEGMELPFTNYTPDFVETVDYIFYSTQTLQVKSLLGPVDPKYCEKYVGFPNPHNPSDHIPIAAHLSFIKR